MEPLAIGSAVVGIISASIRIGKPVYDLTISLHDAPASASAVQIELNEIRSALELLQAYLIGAQRTDVARRSLLSLNHIVATLTGCVTTYSALEALVAKCTTNGDIRGAIERVKWVFYEHDIQTVIMRLQSHKLSLTFMLTILQCESQQQAENNMHRLINMVEAVLERNPDLRTRMDILSADHDNSLGAASHGLRLEGRADSVILPSRPFEDDLNSSKVYKRANERPASLYSLSSTQRESLALSAFSDLSLGNVSMISVLCLPVWSEDLSNAQYFRFGQNGLELTARELEEQYPGIDFCLDTVDEEPEEEELLNTSSVFHSALPLSDTDEDAALPNSDTNEDATPEVLFIAASLFAFSIERHRREGGIPYLTYLAGEVFDVIGMKGELWLAINQDDPKRKMGWIWEKHFARLLPENE
jgi:hypothetical protein